MMVFNISWILLVEQVMLISSKKLVLLYFFKIPRALPSVDSLSSKCVLYFYTNFELQTVWSDSGHIC
jgi:hypothetical protein